MKYILFVISLMFFNPLHSEKVGIIGDSVGVDFYQLMGGRAYPIILQERLSSKNIWIVSDNISASNTYSGVTRLNEMIVTHWPQVIFIGLAANDFFRFFSPIEILSNLETMIQIAERFKIQVVLGKVDLKAYLGKDNFGCCAPATYNPIYIEQVDLIYRTLEAKYPQLLITPYLTVGLVNGTGLTYDFIHATALGHEVLADYVESAIICGLKLRKLRWGS
jgi:lysophospholipase L1-like esterase